MRRIPHQYRWPLAISIALHLIILATLIIQLPTANFRMPGPVSKIKIVHAVAVNQAQIDQQIKVIKQRQLNKQRAEQLRMRKLQAQASAVKRARIRQQRRLAQIKAKQKQLRQQRIARAKALVIMQRKQKLAEETRAKALAAKKQRLAKAEVARKQALANQQQQLQRQLMQQQMAKEQQRLAQVQARQMSGVIDRYKAQILRAIGQEWVIPSGVSKNLSSQFLIQVAPGGMVLSVKLLKSSGNSALDQSARVAILKASPLPVPKNPAIFDKFRQLRLTVSPKEVVNG